MENGMFKLIGAIVVYGFAAFGLAKWLEEKNNASERKET